MIKYTPLAVLLVLFFIAPTFSEAAYKDWSKKEQQLFKTHLTLQAIDTTQTWKMIECQKYTACNLIEKNPLLGNHPRKGDLLVLKIIGNYILYKLLDISPHRERSLKFLNGVGVVVVINNGLYYEKRF